MRAADGKGRRVSTARRELPKFHTRTFVARGQERSDARSTRRRRPSASARPRSMPPASSTTTSPTPAWRRAPCSITSASRRSVAYPGCCGMPFLEQAELARVARPGRARCPRNWCKLIDEGYDIVALTASCGLMLKFEWALIVPDNEDVKRVADAMLRHRRICRGHRARRRACRRAEAAAGRRHRASGLSCARPEYGPEGGGDAAADSRHAGGCDRALLRPWRHLRRGQADA